MIIWCLHMSCGLQYRTMLRTQATDVVVQFLFNPLHLYLKEFHNPYKPINVNR